jgi:agmatinase
MRERQPWFDLHDESCEQPAVSILGLPYDGGAGFRAGAAGAPERMRRLSRTSDPITRRGRNLRGVALRDFGDVAAKGEVGETLAQRDYLDAARRRLEELPAETFLLSLGGDHSVSIPALQAFAARHGQNAGILWFDAHADLFETYDGNPDSHACALRRALTLTGISPRHVVLLATRSFSEEEARFLEQEQVLCITAAEWLVTSSKEVAAKAALHLQSAPAVYLSVDADGFDASCAPGTGYPMPGGVAAEPFFTFLESAFRSLPIRGMDVTEVAPSLDQNDVTTFLAIQTILESLAVLHA